MFLRNIVCISIIVISEGRYEVLEDYVNMYDDNLDEYVNIDESSLVKVEFSKTLSGMMSAMEEIQARADNLIGGIARKEEELAKMQMEAEKAEQKRRELEVHSNRMLDEKKILEDKIVFLIEEKESKEKNIIAKENEVAKTKSLLSPLSQKVSSVENELADLTKIVDEKQNELSSLKTKVAEASQNISSTHFGSPGSFLVPVLLVSLLFNLLTIISLGLSYSSQHRALADRRQEKGVDTEIDDIRSNIREKMKLYPSKVQTAISTLRSQYQLEDGELDTVMRDIWREEPQYYQHMEREEDERISREDNFITLPRGDSISYFE